MAELKRLSSIRRPGLCGSLHDSNVVAELKLGVENGIVHLMDRLHDSNVVAELKPAIDYLLAALARAESPRLQRRGRIEAVVWRA